MKYTQAAGEKSTVKLTITFTGEEWKNAVSQAYRKTRGKYTVPGFRRGKAPQSMLENYYGKGLFYDEAFNILYNEHYFSILEKEKENFTAVGEPALSADEISDGGVTLSAVVPVKPDVNIEAYTGLKIKKYEYNVSDGDVEKEVKKLLERESTQREVADRPCKDGDKVNIDFSGSADGEKFAGGTAEDYDLVLGSGTFIPGFESQVVGMTTGESREINVKFPDDYQSDNLRGKDAVFTVKLNKITENLLPELTDEYVKKHAGSETVEEYRKKTRARLEKSAENRSRDETENSIIEEICARSSAEIPDAMIESETDKIVQEFSYRLMYQGIKLDDYVKYMGQTMEQFRSQFASQAAQRVLSQLVIDKIVKTENFTAEEAEIDKKIKEQAESVDKTFEEYKKTIDPRQIEYIRNDVIITKMFDFLKAGNELVAETPDKDGKPAAGKTSSKKKKEENAAERK